MLKKYVVFSVIFITLFSFNYLNVSAYDFIEQDNESLVNDMIVEIYDSKEQYEDLAGEYEEIEPKIQSGTNSSYWWPVGSEQTIEVDGKIYAKDDPIESYITSNYGYRQDPFGRGKMFHSGVDISTGYGNVNIIAAKDGIVVYPTANVSNDCPSSTSLSDCGGGYGNYVIIQHSDGNYTLYAHLHENSITVVAGDSVSQGQVIAKMGSSGNSTGIHLHFEVRKGQNTYSATVEPLDYISLENPRESFSGAGGEFLSWLKSWEGAGRIEGDYYIVEDLNDNAHTVAAGITMENNSKLFKQYGIEASEYTYHGAKIPVEIVDKVVLDRLNVDRSQIEMQLASCSITLSENQIQALISNRYNVGNINGFCDAYKKYGDTEDFYNNWLLPSKLLVGTQFEKGLRRRRAAEWSLFHEGVYVYNG